MTTEEILEALEENYPDCLLADGFEHALIGVIEGACRPPVACYDFARCVSVLVERDGMTEEEAEEYLEFNTTGAYVGEYTPLFLHYWREEKEHTMTQAQIENIFTYHKPFGDQPERYEQVREKAKEFAYLLQQLCPESREKSLAFTNLQGAVMWANAAIALNEQKDS